MFLDKNLLYYNIIDSIEDKNDFEMTRDESAFLSHFLLEYKPKKILEVGVAAGGTTKLLLSAINSLNLDAELFSVDLNTFYYKDLWNKSDSPRKTCFLCDGLEYGKHHLLTDKYLPQFLDEIGDGIDFCVLDTVHTLPGELLDWIAVLPFLSKNSCLILHDVHMALYSRKSNYSRNANATHIVLDSIAAKKYLFKVDGKNVSLSNIAAALIDENTRKYIESSFLSLSIPWYYLPSETEYEIYYNFYKRFYPEEFCDYFALSYAAQKQIFTR